MPRSQVFPDHIRAPLTLGAAAILAASVVIGGMSVSFLSAQAAPAAAAARPAAQQPATAESFVQQNIDRGYQILKSGNSAQRRDQFHTFLLGLVDARRIGLFTLGQYANSAPKADVEAFLTAFTDYTAAVYETRLDKYKYQILKVKGSVARADDDVVVNCESTDPNRPNDVPYKVAFRIRKGADGRFILTDLNIEGVWQTLSQRADFTGFLQQHGGRVSDLVTDLKRQTQVLYASA